MRSPAFQWYPKDYLSDEHVILMSLEQEGAYRRLIDYCWLHESIPTDLAALALLCRITVDRMEEIWPAIVPCFKERRGRLHHPRIDAESRKQDAWRDKSRAGGKKSARLRAERKLAEQTELGGPLPSAETLDDSKGGSSSTLEPGANIAFASSKEKIPMGSKRKTPLPDDWKASTGHRKRAEELGLDLDDELENFRLHAKATGRLQADWSASFYMWLKKAVDFNTGRRNNGKTPGALARPTIFELGLS